jgi:uroporphyrinogen decarboxylase
MDDRKKPPESSDGKTRMSPAQRPPLASRERVRRAVDFGRPDRVPLSHAVLPAAQLKYGEALAEILTENREDFGWDYMEDLPAAEFSPLYRQGLNRDDFGTLWRVEWLGVCGIPVDWPIKDLDRYDEYRWPRDFTVGPPAGRQYSGHMSGFDPRWYARGGWITYFEELQQLRGMENCLADIAAEPAAFARLLDDLLEFNLRWIDRWTALEYDGLHFGDDWGGQRGLLIRPAAWRRLFKPRYEAMFSRVRSAGMDVWFHTDGFVNDIIGDLVEIGVDVINAQVAVVGHDWIARNARGRVAFRTDIDRQRVLPFGSPAEVKEEVHRTFEACGTPEGGLIACGEVGPDVPLANVRAMYEAFREYGQY